MTSYFGIAVSSIRRGRIDADSWLAADIPAGEEREAYQIEIRKGGVLVRTADVDNANWSYSASQRMG